MYKTEFELFLYKTKRDLLKSRFRLNTTTVKFYSVLLTIDILKYYHGISTARSGLCLSNDNNHGEFILGRIKNIPALAISLIF